MQVIKDCSLIEINSFFIKSFLGITIASYDIDKNISYVGLLDFHKNFACELCKSFCREITDQQNSSKDKKNDFFCSYCLLPKQKRSEEIKRAINFLIFFAKRKKQAELDIFMSDVLKEDIETDLFLEELEESFFKSDQIHKQKFQEIAVKKLDDTPEMLKKYKQNEEIKTNGNESIH